MMNAYSNPYGVAGVRTGMSVQVLAPNKRVPCERKRIPPLPPGLFVECSRVRGWLPGNGALCILKGMKKTVPIILLCMGVIMTAAGTFMMFNRVDWANKLATNQADGPYGAFSNATIEGYNNYAVLTDGDADCDATSDTYNPQLYSPTSVLARAHRQSALPGKSDLKDINRDGENWQWSYTTEVNKGDKAEITCDMDFLLVVHPTEPFGRFVLRIILLGVGGGLLTIAALWLIGLSRKSKDPVHSNPSQDQTTQTSQSQDSKFSANYSKGGMAQGGRISLGVSTFTFEPHSFERGASNAQTLAINYKDIKSVDIAPRTMNPMDGGMRRRLRVTTNNNEQHLFVVNRVAKVRDAVAARLGSNQG